MKYEKLDIHQKRIVDLLRKGNVEESTRQFKVHKNAKMSPLYSLDLFEFMFFDEHISARIFTSFTEECYPGQHHLSYLKKDKIKYDLVKPLKGKVAIESTFQHENFYKSGYPRDVMLRLKLHEMRKMDRRSYDWHPWFETVYNDETVLEVPSTIYGDINKLVDDYEKLVNYLKEDGFLPSSLVTMKEQGNCHVCIDYPFKNDDKKIPFLRKVHDIYNRYPTLAWAFMAGNDNISAKLGEGYPKMVRSRYSVHKKSMDDAYLEFRVFSQPKTTSELMLHIDVVNNIIHHALSLPDKYNYDLTVNAPKTYRLAVKQLEEIMDILEIDHKRLTEHDKLKQLKFRYNYAKDDSSFLT